MIVKKFPPEQHRQGQKAKDFNPECRVVSSTLYNFVIDKYNTLVREYESLSKRAIQKEKQINPFDSW